MDVEGDPGRLNNSPIAASVSSAIHTLVLMTGDDTVEAAIFDGTDDCFEFSNRLWGGLMISK